MVEIRTDYSLQMSASGLFGRNMVDIRSRDAKTTLVFWSTAITGTVFFDHIEVIGEGGMAKIQCAI